MKERTFTPTSVSGSKFGTANMTRFASSNEQEFIDTLNEGAFLNLCSMLALSNIHDDSNVGKGFGHSVFWTSSDGHLVGVGFRYGKARLRGEQFKICAALSNVEVEGLFQDFCKHLQNIGE
tara:strand:- start:2106 stop:2468 length:363 start_codon:yes stop_codon:yes gene_type:complete